MTNVNRSRERIKNTGEVFTSPDLVNEMLDKLPKEVWIDPSKTWIDPASGDGNFLVEVKRRLLEAGHKEKHILENMIFAVDIMPDNINVLQHRLGYLKDGSPNPILDSSHFSVDKLSHECFILDHKKHNTYLHHRNIVCCNSLEYDFSFARKKTKVNPLDMLVW